MPLDPPAGIRQAEPKDERALFAFLKSLHETSPISKIVPYDPGKIVSAIQLGTQRRGGIIGIIDGPDGSIAASAGMLVDEWWWSQTPAIFLRWFHVRAEHRKEGVAHYRHLFEFCLLAREMLSEGQPHPVLLDMSHDSAIDDAELVEAKDRLFGRFGRRVGSIFLAGLPEDFPIKS